MIILKHYLERSYGPRLVQPGSDAKDVPGCPYSLRAGGILALLELLFGSEELERLESKYLSPVHMKWKERARR